MNEPDTQTAQSLSTMAPSTIAPSTIAPSTTANGESGDPFALKKISQLDQPTIVGYFTTINAGEFEATSQLFAINGVMQPPFEEPIEGQAAIEHYLRTEAKGLKAHPHEGVVNLLNDGSTEVQVGGKVQMPWFSVNVAWQFVLNRQQDIQFVRIRLLASPQELLGMRR